MTKPAAHRLGNSWLLGGFLLSGLMTTTGHAQPTPLPGTLPLVESGDIASNLVAGVDRFLTRKLEAAAAGRGKMLQEKVIEEVLGTGLVEYRQRLARMAGVRDKWTLFQYPEIISKPGGPTALAMGDGYEVLEVRWPAFGNVHGEGLLLRPLKHPPLAVVVTLPDAEQTLEQLAGLVEGVPVESQFARRLAESGCLVVVPALINRNMGPHKGRAQMTAREFLHRSAFELGRTMTGYEVQKVLGWVGWARTQPDPLPVGVIGYGEGGRLALFTAALEQGVQAAAVSGHFTERNAIWEEPMDRNIFGLLGQFGDAELVAMAARQGPRVVIEAAEGPIGEFPGKGGGAPARLVSPDATAVKREFQRALSLAGEDYAKMIKLVVSGDGQGPFGTTETVDQFLQQLLPKGREAEAKHAPLGKLPQRLRTLPDTQARHQRRFDELDRHNQWLLTESPYVRAEFMKKLDTSSPEKFAASAEHYRTIFRDEVIGWFDDPLLPFNARTRKAYDTEKWTGYEVVLDVFPDVIAYGILLLPKDLKPGEQRPVVVCQHGLEGRPQDLITGNHAAYHDFAAKLAERGFITFAPQNLYLFRDRFRVLQRKANPLGKTLYSIITPQHQQIINWLKTLPNVDRQRIGFYGLSYGGKTAMRVPALLTDYCLSICSGDFNEWVWKNASSRSPYSYVWTGEYEIFEFDLGSTFNYAEMAALIAPRPFMVERGHFDGVAPDEMVAHEYAKVQHLYAAKLKLPERTAIEWFPGPHTINGKGTFEFLHQHLQWPKPNR